MSAFGGHHSGKSGHQEMSANDPKHPGPFRRLAGIAVHIGARVAALWRSACVANGARSGRWLRTGV
jgi:hypothetical protein